MRSGLLVAVNPSMIPTESYFTTGSHTYHKEPPLRPQWLSEGSDGHQPARQGARARLTLAEELRNESGDAHQLTLQR